MTAAAPVEDLLLERAIAGIGTVIFEQKYNRDGSTRARGYWLRPEGAERRRRLQSVTEILSEAWPTSRQLQEWMKREGLRADESRNAAAARGTTIHRFIERYLVEGDVLPFAEFPADYRPFFQATADFLWEHEPAPIDAERLICHPELDYAGRLDLIATLTRACGVNGCGCAPLVDVPTLWDFKTSASGRVYAKAHAQTAAYRMADERCGSAAIERTAILGIGEDGHYEIVESPFEDAKKLWCSTLEFHRTMQRFERTLGKGAR